MAKNEGSSQANTRHWTNAGLILAHRLLRWPNINAALVKHIVFALKSRRDEVIELTSQLKLGQGHSIEVDLKISVVHMRLKSGGSKSRRYEVIALTSDFCFRDLVTLKLGQGRWISNLVFRSVWCTCGKNMRALCMSRRYEVIALTNSCSVRPQFSSLDLVINNKIKNDGATEFSLNGALRVNVAWYWLRNDVGLKGYTEKSKSEEICYAKCNPVWSRIKMFSLLPVFTCKTFIIVVTFITNQHEGEVFNFLHTGKTQ